MLFLPIPWSSIGAVCTLKALRVEDVLRWPLDWHQEALLLLP